MHKHAENMMLYAQDAMETDKPWEKWEVKLAGTNNWIEAVAHLSWASNTEYRRKRKMILVNGIEVPAPETEKPEMGQEYYVPSIRCEDKYQGWIWRNDNADNRWLKEGLVYLPSEDAIARAKAMMKWEEL